MSTLYELTGDYLQLLDMAEDDSVDAETLADTMEAISGELDDKIENYGKLIKQIEADALALKGEIDRLSARKKALDNSTARMKKAVEGAMRAVGKQKIKTELFTFGIQKNPASLRIADDVDMAEIPAEFIKFADPEIDRTAVKEAIKNGAEFRWATLEQTEGLRIR